MVSFSITCNCRSRGEVSLFYSRLRIQSRYLVLRPSMMILSRSFFLSNHFSPLALIFFILIVHVFNLIFMCALITLKKKKTCIYWYTLSYFCAWELEGLELVVILFSFIFYIFFLIIASSTEEEILFCFSIF